MVEETIIIRSFLFCRKSFLIHKHQQCKIHNKAECFLAGKCCQSRWRGDYLGYVGWSVKCCSPCIWDIYFWGLNTHQLKITCLSTGKRTRYTQGMCEPARWRPRVSADFLNLGAWEVSPPAPLPSHLNACPSSPHPASGGGLHRSRVPPLFISVIRHPLLHREANIKPLKLSEPSKKVKVGVITVIRLAFRRSRVQLNP